MFRFKDYTRYPASIFSGIFKIIFTFVIPIAFVAYYPSLTVLGSFADAPLLSKLSPLIGMLFFWLSYKFWMLGVKKYDFTGSWVCRNSDPANFKTKSSQKTYEGAVSKLLGQPRLCSSGTDLYQIVWNRDLVHKISLDRAPNNCCRPFWTQILYFCVQNQFYRLFWTHKIRF